MMLMRVARSWRILQDAGASAQSASGQRDADSGGYYVLIKERGDSDNIAAVQAILSDVVCGVGGCCDDGSSRLSLSVSLPFSAEARRGGRLRAQATLIT
jgi:hypothetical protein